jgi:diguanylate cyclase (GGDEF)-like protein/PAS domain S-box-containing protein
MFNIKFKSIGRRFVFATSLFITILLVMIAAGTYSYFHHTTQQLIFDQQFSMITSMAHDLDQQITLAHTALINVANVAPPDIVTNRAATQKWLENRTGIATIFNNSLVVLDKAGTLIAIVPVHPDMYGSSLAHREYFKNSITSGKPYISAPFMAAATARPIVMMTAPFRAKDGSIKGLLCGSIDLLSKDGIFAATSDTHLGSAGYLYMFATDRTMIMHPDTSRIMKKDVQPGVNRIFDMALEGFEGSGETVNSRGVPFLASFKRLQTTGWILAANYPTAEAYQTITRFRNYYLSAMFFVLLISVGLAWRLGAGITRPLSGFTLQIKDLAQPDSDRRLRLEVNRVDELGQLAGSFNALLDEVQQDEQELKKNETRFRQMFEGHGVIMMMIEPHSGKIVDANSAAARFYGYSVAQLKDMNISYINQLSAEEIAINREQSATGAERSFVFPHRLSDGSIRMVEVHSTPIGDSDHVLLYSIVQDVTERKQAEEVLAHEATHDPLTGALNRRAVLDALSRESSRVRRQHTGLAVAICDIDHFKEINDTHGHMVGDEVLCSLVRLLESRLRPYDYLGRWGGEEFVLILPDVKENDEDGLCDRLRKVVMDTPIATKAGSVSITISFGVKIWKDNENVDQLITAADVALYQAKSEGRNRVCFAD